MERSMEQEGRSSERLRAVGLIRGRGELFG